MNHHMGVTGTAAVELLAAATDAALRSRRPEAWVCEAIRPAMAALLVDRDPLPPGARDPYEGGAVGNLVYADPEARFHILVVVFPEGTSSGIHLHGCWGVIGYLQGGDEETRYRWRDGRPVEESRHVWHQGDITYLLPDEMAGPDGRAGCWHRVRNPGPGVGVSVHVLCRLPADHPHDFWDRDEARIVAFPFVERAPGRWQAMLGR